MSTPPTPTPVRRDIQGLRALAVIAVVLDHALAWPRGGFVGVDVFFVISGFLITAVLLREIAQTGRIRLGGFLARRVRRILPAALVVPVTVTLVGFVVFNRPRAEQTLGDALAALVSLVNWRFVAEGADYFASSPSVLQHFWSLSVEEQFYLVWPVLLLIAVLCLPSERRRSRGALVVGALAAVVVVASFGWALIQSTAAPTTAYFSTATRAWELGVGALLAAAMPLLARIPRVIGALLGWVGLAGVVWAFLTVDPDATAFPGPGAALPVLATALVIAGGVGGDPRARHLYPVTNPVAVFVGDVSYSLYLWHLPVLVFAAVLLPDDGPVATAIVVGSMVALTLASYWVVEQPLHRSPLLRRATRERASAAEATTAAGMDADDARPTQVVDAVAAAEPVPAPVPVPVASAPAAPSVAMRSGSIGHTVAQRPAGWVPGTRYFPGSRPAPAPSAPAPLAPGGSAAASAPLVPQPAGIAPPPRQTAPPPVPVAAESAPRTDHSWAAWRARFGGQMLFASLGLVIAAGLVVLTVQNTYGGPVFDVPGIAAPAGPADAAAPADPLPALQAELAAAASATSWPRLSPSIDEVIATSSADNAARTCFTPGIPIDAARCSWGAADAATHLYLVGDSTAMAYAPAFKKLAEDSAGALRVTTVGMYGCRFTDVLVYNPDVEVMAECAQRKLDVRAMLTADAPQSVVVANAYTLGHTIDDRDLSANELAAAAAAEAATYGVPGRIAYLAPPPSGADLARCYSPLTGPAACLAGVDATWQQMAAATAANAAASGDHAVSSLPFSCVDGVCPAFAGSRPTKYDQTHLTVAFAEHIAPVLRWELTRVGLL